MAPVHVDPAKVREFASKDAFYDWLKANHDSEDEVWIRIFKKASGKPTITAVEAIDVVLCWGWIDAIRKSWDEVSFVQRYTHRGRKSLWSQVNKDNVARLVEEGKMTDHGLKHVDVAKADGRWDAAYGTTMDAPDDLLAAIEANPAASEFYRTLTAQNRFALIFRTINLKTPAPARLPALSRCWRRAKPSIRRARGSPDGRLAGLLRGINLGKRQVKMGELRTCLEDVGFTDIKTVVASGNVRLVGAGDADEIKTRLETAIEAQFGFAVGVVLRSEAELTAMLESHPFASIDPKADVARHVLMFDKSLPAGIALAGMPGHTEIVRIDAREVYIVGYRQPNGRYTEAVEAVLKPLYARLGKGALDTMRNWNTIEKMLA